MFYLQVVSSISQMIYFQVFFKKFDWSDTQVLIIRYSMQYPRICCQLLQQLILPPFGITSVWKQSVKYRNISIIYRFSHFQDCILSSIPYRLKTWLTSVCVLVLNRAIWQNGPLIWSAKAHFSNPPFDIPATCRACGGNHLCQCTFKTELHQKYISPFLVLQKANWGRETQWSEDGRTRRMCQQIRHHAAWLWARSPIHTILQEMHVWSLGIYISITFPINPHHPFITGFLGNIRLRTTHIRKFLNCW